MAYVLTGCVADHRLEFARAGTDCRRSRASLGSGVPTVMMAGHRVWSQARRASALFLARHIDRIGARRMLQFALTLLAAALAFSAASPIVSVLIACQLVAGIASGIALPAIYSSAAAIAPPGRAERLASCSPAGRLAWWSVLHCPRCWRISCTGARCSRRLQSWRWRQSRCSRPASTLKFLQPSRRRYRWRR